MSKYAQGIDDMLDRMKQMLNTMMSIDELNSLLSLFGQTIDKKISNVITLSNELARDVEQNPLVDEAIHIEYRQHQELALLHNAISSRYPETLSEGLVEKCTQYINMHKRVMLISKKDGLRELKRKRNEAERLYENQHEETMIQQKLTHAAFAAEEAALMRFCLSCSDLYPATLYIFQVVDTQKDVIDELKRAEAEHSNWLHIVQQSCEDFRSKGDNFQAILQKTIQIQEQCQGQYTCFQTVSKSFSVTTNFNGYSDLVKEYTDMNLSMPSIVQQTALKRQTAQQTALKRQTAHQTALKRQTAYQTSPAHATPQSNQPTVQQILPIKSSTPQTKRKVSQQTSTVHPTILHTPSGDDIDLALKTMASLLLNSTRDDINILQLFLSTTRYMEFVLSQPEPEQLQPRQRVPTFQAKYQQHVKWQNIHRVVSAFDAYDSETVQQTVLAYEDTYLKVMEMIHRVELEYLEDKLSDVVNKYESHQHEYHKVRMSISANTVSTKIQFNLDQEIEILNLILQICMKIYGVRLQIMDLLKTTKEAQVQLDITSNQSLLVQINKFVQDLKSAIKYAEDKSWTKMSEAYNQILGKYEGCISTYNTRHTIFTNVIKSLVIEIDLTELQKQKGIQQANHTSSREWNDLASRFFETKSTKQAKSDDLSTFQNIQRLLHRQQQQRQNIIRKALQIQLPDLDIKPPDLDIQPPDLDIQPPDLDIQLPDLPQYRPSPIRAIRAIPNIDKQSDECLKTLNEGFKQLEKTILGVDMLFTATYNTPLFTISGKTQQGNVVRPRPEVLIDATTISCMLDTVPEVILLYVIAQMMKIANATGADQCDELISKAHKHIQRKIALFRYR